MRMDLTAQPVIDSAGREINKPPRMQAFQQVEQGPRIQKQILLRLPDRPGNIDFRRQVQTTLPIASELIEEPRHLFRAVQIALRRGDVRIVQARYERGEAGAV